MTGTTLPQSKTQALNVRGLWINAEDNVGCMSLYVVLGLLPKFQDRLRFSFLQMHGYFLGTHTEILFLDHQGLQSIEDFFSFC